MYTILGYNCKNFFKMNEQDKGGDHLSPSGMVHDRLPALEGLDDY